MAEETLWDWIDRLGDKSEDVRMKAREEIVRIGQRAAPILARAIDSELIPSEAQSFAQGTLAEIKPLYEGEKPDALMQALEEGVYWDACAAVSRALVNFGTAATGPLLELLTCGDKRIYEPSASALAELAKGDPSIMPAVIKALDDENWNVRSGATEVLRYVEAPWPAEAIVPLIRSLNDENEDHRSKIVHVLEWFGAAVIPGLLEALRSQNWKIRAGSAKALGFIELARKLPAADREPYVEIGVLPALVEALGDEEIEVFVEAAEALSLIGPPETNLAIPVLLRILRERNPLRFSEAAANMGWIPCSEPGFETELIDALGDRYEGIRVSAADLLGRIELPATSAAVPALLQALEDHSEDVRFQAAYALAGIDPAVSRAGIPILHSVLIHGLSSGSVKDTGSYWETREYAIRGLARHGPAAAEAVPALIDSLSEFCVADWAADTLRSIGPSAGAAVPALLKALASSDENLRYSAARALAAIGEEAASAAATIVLERLRKPDEFNRCDAADLLGEIGLPGAKAAIPVLLELMHDDSEVTRRHVGWALEELGCNPPAGSLETP